MANAVTNALTHDITETIAENPEQENIVPIIHLPKLSIFYLIISHKKQKIKYRKKLLNKYPSNP